MVNGSTQVFHAIYTKADLSQPYQPFVRDTSPPTPESPAVYRYALAEAPFFVRVWLGPTSPAPTTPVLTPLHRHRPQGRHPADAQLAVPRRSAGGCATLLRQSGHGRE